MAESDQTNGVYVEINDERSKETETETETTLYDIFHRLISTIINPRAINSRASGEPLHQRIKISLSDNVPHFRSASANSARHLLHWTRRGSSFRALLVISVGAISLILLTGLLVFMLFFVAATINTVIVSLLVSLAIAGGFIAVFLAFGTAVYIGALAVAAFIISTATVSAIVAALIATGWAAFFLSMWVVAKKGLHFAKHSLSTTGSALSAYAIVKHVHRSHEPDKSAD